MFLLIHPEPAVSGCVGVTVARSIGASMDRLLRYFLGQFIRRGTTRDYITREEARLRGLELGKQPRLQLAGE
jgi:hypothetical protein